MADTGNAHVRQANSTRRAPEIEAEEASRLLNDPAFLKGFNGVRDGLLRELENMQHDGQPETDDFEREVCRALRTLNRLKRAIGGAVQGQVLRAADFRSRDPKDSE